VNSGLFDQPKFSPAARSPVRHFSRRDASSQDFCDEICLGSFWALLVRVSSTQKKLSPVRWRRGLADNRCAFLIGVSKSRRWQLGSIFPSARPSAIVGGEEQRAIRLC
jgi:hypothetical protein